MARTRNTPVGTRIVARLVYTEGGANRILFEEARAIGKAGEVMIPAFSPPAWPVGAYEAQVGMEGTIRKTRSIRVLIKS